MGVALKPHKSSKYLQASLCWRKIHDKYAIAGLLQNKQDPLKAIIADWRETRCAPDVCLQSVWGSELSMFGRRSRQLAESTLEAGCRCCCCLCQEEGEAGSLDASRRQLSSCRASEGTPLAKVTTAKGSVVFWLPRWLLRLRGGWLGRRDWCCGGLSTRECTHVDGMKAILCRRRSECEPRSCCERSGCAKRDEAWRTAQRLCSTASTEAALASREMRASNVKGPDPTSSTLRPEQNLCSAEA